MEPRNEQKTVEPCSEEKQRRFRIERLEERIAPKRKIADAVSATCPPYGGADMCGGGGA